MGPETACFLGTVRPVQRAERGPAALARVPAAHETVFGVGLREPHGASRWRF